MDEKLWAQFLKQTKKNGDCLLWTGPGFGKDGYGLYKNGDVKLLAHRAAYIMQNDGYVPEGRVLQSCGHKRCVNIEHLSEEPSVTRP